jgi:glycosyltransferase involved in cell wall biosynthesis
MKKPKVSIIIPNYNHASFLKQRLESVYHQTFQDFEVILLDDASTDSSLEILNTYKDQPKTVHFIVNKSNSGSPFKQWQKGLELAKGNYIWIAESDDYCELTFLDKMITYLNNNSEVGLAYCQTIDVNERGEKISNRIEYTKEFLPNIWESNFKLNGTDFNKSYLIKKNVIPNASAVLFKKELVTKDFFTEKLVAMKMCGDWLFWVQLALKTEVGFLAKNLNYFRSHEKISRNHTTSKIKKLRLIEEGDISALLQEKNIINLKVEQVLYKKWFKLHPLYSLSSPSFYKVKLPKTATFTFLLQFLKFKLK